MRILRSIALAGVCAAVAGACFAQAAGSPQSDYMTAIRAADAALKRGKPAQALPSAQKAYVLGRQSFPQYSKELYPAVNMLFQSLQMSNKLAEAAKYADELLMTAQKAFGKDHAQYGVALQVVAHFHQSMGDISRAKKEYAASADLLSGQQMPYKVAAVDSLRSLVALNRKTGNYEEAAERLHQLMELAKPILPPFHPKTAQVLMSAGDHYKASGDLERAESLYVSALEVYQKVHGDSNNPDYAYAGMLLGSLYRHMGEYELAFKNLRKSLMAYDSIYGKDGLQTVGAKHSFASLMLNVGEYSNAIALEKAALEIMQRHKRVTGAGSHANNLAWAYLYTEDLQKAEELFRKAYNMDCASYGPESEYCANILASLSLVKQMQGKPAEALTCAERSEAVYEGMIRHFSVTGSELQKIGFLKKLEGKTHLMVELGVKNPTPNGKLVRLGMQTVIRRKGRAADLMFSTLKPLKESRDPEVLQLLSDLADLREQLASAMMSKAQDPKEKEMELQVLQRKIHDSESLLYRRAQRLPQAAVDITVEAVARSLPKGSVLVEYVYYKPTDLKTPKVDADKIAGRYAVFCLSADNRVTVADLGEARAIDAHIAKLRQSVMRSAVSEFHAPAKALHRLLIEPVMKMAPQSRRFFLAPDAQLHLLPYNLLLGSDDKYLLESTVVSYLSSGRDLLERGAPAQSKSGAVVFANPDFELSGAGAGSDAGETRTVDLAGTHFSPLPGTAKEAQALHAVMPSAKLLLAGKATEGMLKDVDSPVLLHIATHGFFLQDPFGGGGNNRGLKKKNPSKPVPLAPQPKKRADGWVSVMETSVENSLMKSGLALAGANKAADSDGEGILTALEASQLRLDGTKMVVLSACETGLGDVRNGEGVMGLKRAFLLAGSQTQVMSLWKVHDDATQQLMALFYENLKKRQPKPEAMRNAQLEMLKTRYKHPFYWAAFTVSGDYGTF